MDTSHTKRIILSLVFMNMMTQAGLVLYTPAFVQIAHDLHITSSLVKSTIAIYLFGIGISQLFYGALSDRLGRKKAVLTGMTIFSLGCLWSIFTNDYYSLLMSRLIQGIGAGSGITLSRCILRDCFTGKQYTSTASYLSTGFSIGLGAAPLIGGWLLYHFSWHSEFVFLLLSGVSLFIFFALFMPETHHPSQPKIPLNSYLVNLSHFYWQMMKNRYLFGYLLGGVLSYSVVTAYTTMAPFLIQKTLGYSSFFYGFLTFLIGIAYYLGAWLNRYLHRYLSTQHLMKLGLALIMASGLTMLLDGLLIHSFNLHVIFIPLWIATIGQTLIWSNCVAGALHDHSENAGAAAAFFSCLQMLLSALIAAIIAVPHEHNQVPLAITITSLGVGAWLIFQLIIWREKEKSS